MNSSKKHILKRNFKIYQKHISGIKFSELSKEYDISPERVRQIFNKIHAKEQKLKAEKSICDNNGFTLVICLYTYQ